ncbi:hypothetical protein EVG20_g6070 [Dentipellis fragilis]|uniref:Uncharacterized protein n=1 Tax=Dentipellis fragilis TaxID=205917 RepID=A0A4Y9YPI8_9AGAM|nr:hypothetical protein EVG20_g6070 [Dentipellis fragilis]
MATPNPSPGFTLPSTDPTPILSRRRTNERPKGSLPTYSRPQPWRPSLPHAVRTGYSVKSVRVGKGTEGVLSRRSRDHDETEQLLKWSADVRQRSRETVQDSINFFGNLEELNPEAESKKRNGKPINCGSRIVIFDGKVDGQAYDDPQRTSH